MEVRCDKCQARYRVDDARIGPQGLNMRCGKCQNTFKVLRPDAQAGQKDSMPPAPAPAAPAHKAATPASMPSAPAHKPAAPASMPSAPAPKPAGPAAKPAASEGRALEGAGRTMMFQTGNLKSTPAAAKPAGRPEAAHAGAAQTGAPPPPHSPEKPAPARTPAKGAEPDPRATMVFGQAPVARPAPAKPAPPARPASKDDAAGSTMMFGVSPPTAKAPPPAPAPQDAAEAGPLSDGAASEAESEEQRESEGDAAAREEAGSGVEAEAEGAEEDSGEGEAKPGTFDKAPPKGLLIGVAAGLAVLLVGGGALVLVKKVGKHAPPPAAIETLTSAQADADKDSLSSLASAEGKARDAIDVAGPKSAFPQAAAALARIEIQWADALNDQAALLAAKGGGDESKPADLSSQAKAKLKAAFGALSPALKADPKSPDLQLTLADYYRAQRSGSNMNKALKSAQALGADDARVAQVQGMALLQEEDGAEKALPKLKAAVAGNPQSARLHFRLALAYQALKDEAAAAAELKETLRISPHHERAKTLLETAAGASGK